MRTWALSRATNPAVLRLHTTLELTPATIETCPPSEPPHPLDRLLEIRGIRSMDLHRHPQGALGGHGEPLYHPWPCSLSMTTITTAAKDAPTMAIPTPTRTMRRAIGLTRGVA